MATKRRDKKPVIVHDDSQFIDGLINDMLSGQGLEPITDELIGIFAARGMDPDELRKMRDVGFMYSPSRDGFFLPPDPSGL